MKYFVFADVHGYYSLLMEELKNKQFDINNPEHMLISLGDNFDRGLENFKMYEFLKEMKNLNKIILIKGNHEDLFLQMLYNRKATFTDMTNGTYQTLIEFISHYFNENFEDMFYYYPSDVYKKLRDEGIIDFIYDMEDYYETNNYIFTHGFIPINNQDMTYKEDWRNSSKKEFESSRWLNGIDMSLSYHIGEPNKKIVIGHFHTSFGHVRKEFLNKTNKEYRTLEFKENANFDIYKDENIYALDACTHYTKKINLLVLED